MKKAMFGTLKSVMSVYNSTEKDNTSERFEDRLLLVFWSDVTQGIPL